MARPKVAYIGNCQAQAMTSLAGFLGLNQDNIHIPPVWTLTEEDRAQLEAAYRESDYVFLQRVDSSFHVDFVKADYVRTLVPTKTILTWPVIYFDGYFPGIRYLYADEGKVEGPLADYHFDWIIEAFRRNLPPEKAEATILGHGSRRYFSPVENSISNLMAREIETDTEISDYIITFFRHVKLFYAMNHPKSVVLVEMMKRLHRTANIPFLERDVEDFPYHLNHIDVPALSVFMEKYRPTFANASSVKGIEIAPDTRKPLPDITAHYSLLELIQTFYSVYSALDPFPQAL